MIPWGGGCHHFRPHRLHAKRIIERVTNVTWNLSRLKSPVSSKAGIKSLQFIHQNKPINESIQVQGWVKAIRNHKKINFWHLYDGTSNTYLQVILNPNLCTGVTVGTSVNIHGLLSASTHRKQPVELIAESVTVIGPGGSEEAFPLPSGKKLPLNELRQFPHLRPRFRAFSSILRMRSKMSSLLHKYLEENGYYQIHTPVLTSNDAEGGGDIFKVEPLKNIITPSSDDEETTEDEKDEIQSNLEEQPNTQPRNSSILFDHPVFLTVSGQLHLESIVCGGLPKVYTFGPIFRAENTRTRQHLSEFHMLEAEIAFIHSLDEILDIIEDMIRTTTENFLSLCSEDMCMLEKYLEKNQSEYVFQLLRNKFIRITYADALSLLNRKSRIPEPLPWGTNFKRRHEEELVRLCGNVPLFLTDFPASIKAFYMKSNSGPEDTVAAVDLLVPEVGELCGGSIREDKLPLLENKMKQFNANGSLDWYLELRKFGSIPHGGFGLGFERFLRFATGVRDVKDVIPFPRWPHHCLM